MTTDLDRFRQDGEERGKHTDRNQKLRCFGQCDRSKARIIERGGPCGFNHGAVQRQKRGGISYAASKISPDVQGSESAAKFGEVFRHDITNELASFEGRKD